MSKTLQIVHICSHVIQQSIELAKTDSLIRSSDKDYDVIKNVQIVNGVTSTYDVTVTKVSAVYNNGIMYIPNMDFVLFTHNKIKWIGIHSPNPGDTYDVDYDIINVNNVQYDQSSCPRCNGDGWYTGIIDDDTSKVSSVTDIEKLVQDFMKILLTSKNNGIGTDLISLAGREMYSQDEMSNMIITIVRDAETQCKNMQLQMVSDGTPISDEERLYTIDISDIEFNSIDFGFILSLGIVNVVSDNAKVNIKI